MKKYLIYLIPGLLMLNACTEGRGGLTADQATVIEDSLVHGEEGRQDEATLKNPPLDGSDLPTDDGSHSLAPDATLGQVPTEVTPALPPSGQSNPPDVQAVGPGFHFQASDLGSKIQGIHDDNTNLSAQAEDQGMESDSGSVQATGSRPPVGEAGKLAVYDPFCNCYKTGPNNGPTSMQDANPPLSVQDPALGVKSTSDEDEDSDD